MPVSDKFKEAMDQWAAGGEPATPAGVSPDFKQQMDAWATATPEPGPPPDQATEAAKNVQFRDRHEAAVQAEQDPLPPTSSPYGVPSFGFKATGGAAREQAPMEGLGGFMSTPSPDPPASSSDYDYERAKGAGLSPDDTGHWPSRVPKGENEGLILKSEYHETFGKTIEGEKDAGMTMYRHKDSGDIYSFPTSDLMPPGYEEFTPKPQEPPGRTYGFHEGAPANALRTSGYLRDMSEVGGRETGGVPYAGGMDRRQMAPEDLTEFGKKTLERGIRQEPERGASRAVEELALTRGPPPPLNSHPSAWGAWMAGPWIQDNVINPPKEFVAKLAGDLRDVTIGYPSGVPGERLPDPRMWPFISGYASAIARTEAQVATELADLVELYTGADPGMLRYLAENTEEFVMRNSGIPYEHIPLDALADYRKDMERLVMRMSLLSNGAFPRQAGRDQYARNADYTDIDFSMRQVQRRLNEAIGTGVRVMAAPGIHKEIGRGEQRARGTDISMRNMYETQAHFWLARGTIPLTIVAGLMKEFHAGGSYVKSVVEGRPEPYIPLNSLYHSMKDLALSMIPPVGAYAEYRAVIERDDLTDYEKDEQLETLIREQGAATIWATTTVTRHMLKSHRRYQFWRKNRPLAHLKLHEDAVYRMLPVDVVADLLKISPEAARRGKETIGLKYGDLEEVAPEPGERITERGREAVEMPKRGTLMGELRRTELDRPQVGVPSRIQIRSQLQSLRQRVTGKRKLVPGKNPKPHVVPGAEWIEEGPAGMKGAQHTETGEQRGLRDPRSYQKRTAEDRIVQPPKGGWTEADYRGIYGDLGWKLYRGVPPEAPTGFPNAPLTPPDLGFDARGRLQEFRKTPEEAGPGGLPRLTLNDIWPHLPPDLKSTVNPEVVTRNMQEILNEMSPGEYERLIRISYAMTGLSLKDMPVMDTPAGAPPAAGLGPHVYMPVFVVHDQVPIRTALGIQTATVRRKLTPEQLHEMEPDMTPNEIYRLETRGGVYEVDVAVRPGTAGMGTVGRRELVIGDRITELMQELAGPDMEGAIARRVSMSREDIARLYREGGEAAVNAEHEARLAKAQEQAGQPRETPPEPPEPPPGPSEPPAGPGGERFGPEGVAGFGADAQAITDGGTRGKVIRKLSDADVDEFAAQSGEEAEGLKAEGLYEVEILDGPNAGSRVHLMSSDLTDRPPDTAPPAAEAETGQKDSPAKKPVTPSPPEGEKPEPEPTKPEPQPEPPPVNTPPDIPTAPYVAMGRPGTARAGQVVIDTAVVLVDPNEVKHSKHPEYLDERLQKRRGDEESAETVEFLKKNQVLSELGDNQKADSGAPLLLRDNSILSGNHRYWAWMKMMTEPEFAQRRAEYIEWAKDEALRMGIEVDAELWEAKLPPMLARRITGTFESWDQMIQFAMDANTADLRPEGPLGQAGMDAARMKLEDLALYDPGSEITSQTNLPFARKFRERLGTSKGITSGGKLNQNGIRRLKNAVMVMAYGLTKADHPMGPEMSDAVLLTMMETEVEGTKRLNNALLRSAGEWAKFRQDVRDGKIDPRADLTVDLVSAVAKIVAIREAGKDGGDASIDKFFRQLALSEEVAYPESMKYLVALLGETGKSDVMATAGVQDIRIQPGKNRIFIANSADLGAQLIKNYIEEVRKFADRTTVNMFGEREVPPTLEMLKAARRTLEGKEREEDVEGGLLDDIEPTPDVPTGKPPAEGPLKNQEFYDAVAEEGRRRPRLAKLMDVYAKRVAGEISTEEYAKREKGLSATWALGESAIAEAKTIVDGVLKSGIKPGKVETKPAEPGKPVEDEDGSDHWTEAEKATNAYLNRIKHASEEKYAYADQLQSRLMPGGGIKQEFKSTIEQARAAAVERLGERNVRALEDRFLDLTKELDADESSPQPEMPRAEIVANLRGEGGASGEQPAGGAEKPAIPYGSQGFEKDTTRYIESVKRKGGTAKAEFAQDVLDYYMGRISETEYASRSETKQLTSIARERVRQGTQKIVTDLLNRKWTKATGEKLVWGPAGQHSRPIHLKPKKEGGGEKPGEGTESTRPAPPKAGPGQEQRDVDLQWQRGYEHIEKNKNAKERAFLELNLHSRVGVIDSKTYHEKAEKLDIGIIRGEKIGSELLRILDRAEEDARLPKGMKRAEMLRLEEQIEQAEQRFFWEEGLSDKAKSKLLDKIAESYRKLEQSLPKEITDAIEAHVSTGANAGDEVLLPTEKKDGTLEFKPYTVLDTDAEGSAVKIERGGKKEWVPMDEVFPKKEFEEFLRESDEFIDSFEDPAMRKAAKKFRDTMVGKNKADAEFARYGERVEVRSKTADGEEWLMGKIVRELRTDKGEPLYEVDVDAIGQAGDTTRVPFRDIRALNRGTSRMATSKEAEMKQRMLELWRKRMKGATPGVKKAQGKVPKGEEGGKPEGVGVSGQPEGAAGGIRGNSAPSPTAPVGPTDRGDRPHPDAGELEPDTGGSDAVGGGVTGPATASPGLGASVVSTGRGRGVKQKKSIFSAIRESRLLRSIVAAAEWNLFSAARKKAWEAARNSPVVAPYQSGTRFWRSPGERQLVESRGQAGVPRPENTYQPTRELMELHKKGNFFNHQMDGIAMAMQASEFGGHGVLIADAPGVGKSRIIAGTIHELVGKGARRILVTTIGGQNIQNLKDEFNRTFDGEAPFNMVVLTKDYYFAEGKKGKKTIIPKVPSTTLEAEKGTVYFMDQSNFAKYLPMMVDMEFHAWLADEAHTYRRTETQKAAQWRELHIDFERRGVKRIHYLTATPAAEIKDFSHYYNLGMYSTARGSFEQWLSVVSGRGRQMTQSQWISSQIETLRDLLEDRSNPHWSKKHKSWEIDLVELEARAELLPPPGEQVTQHVQADEALPSFLPAEYEQIARELKTSGKFRSLDVWRGDLELDVIDRQMTPEQRTHLDLVSNLLRDTELLFQKARKAGSPDASRWGVRSGLQFEIKRRMFHMKKDLVMKSIREILDKGGNVVISLINVSPTGETGGHLGGAIRQIPTSRTIKRGHRRIIITEDTHPNDPHIVMMKAEKEALLLRMKEEIGPVSDPIQDIIKEFGAENVGLIIGESEAQKASGMGKVEYRENVRKEFQANKRRIVVISAAGAAGIDLHHITTSGLENTEMKGRVSLIAIDTEMSPMDMVQKLGRVDRVGQISTPRLFLTSLGTPADKKFISSITAKLQGLGAISRGLSRATGTENLEQYDFFDPISASALQRAWVSKFSKQEKAWFLKRDFIDPKSWANGVPGQMTPAKYLLKATPKDFLADLQLIPSAIGESMFKKWMEVRRAMMLGGAVDEGQVEKENYSELSKEARELGMTPEQLRWFRQDAALRRSRFDTGKILKDIELTPHTALTIVRSDKGGVYGLLNGVFTDRMQAILEDGIGRTSNGKLPARSYVNFRGNEGAEISGLRIRRSSVDRIADLYGKRVLDQEVTAANAVEFLRMDHSLELRERPWRLRMRPDGLVVVSVNRTGGRVAKWDAEIKEMGGLLMAGKNVYTIDSDQVPAWVEKYGIQLAPKGNATASRHSAGRTHQRLSSGTRNFALASTTAGGGRGGKMPSDPAKRRKLMESVARGEDVRAAWRTINAFAVKLDQVVRRGLLGAKGSPEGTGTLGFFRVGQEVIRRRMLNDMRNTLKTIGHEFGHLLAKKMFGFTLTEAALRGDEVRLNFEMFQEPYKSELDTLSQEHAKPDLGEGWANFLMYYITDREHLRQEAPNTYDYVERRLAGEFPEWKELYDTANRDFARHQDAPALAQVGGQVVYAVPRSRNVLPWDRWYELLVDRIHILDITERYEFLQGHATPPGERGAVQMRLNAGSHARFEFFTTRGQFDFHGLRRMKSQVEGTPFTGKNAPGLKQIFGLIWKDRIEWTNYAIALRTRELRKKRGIHGVPLPDEVISRAIKEGKSELFDQVVDLYQEYNKNLLQYAKDGGMLDGQGFASILAMNEYYIPFRRLVEDTPLEQRSRQRKGHGTKLVNLPTPFKKIKKGVDLPLLDPIEAIFENTELIIRTADRAYATKMFIDNARKYEGLGGFIEKFVPDPESPGELKAIEIQTKGMGKHVEPVPRSKQPISIRVDEILKKKQLKELRRRMKEMGLDKVLEDAEREMVTIFRNTPVEMGENTVLVWENGKRQAYRLSPELYEALSGLSAQAVNFNLGLMRAPARWLQKGALSTVGFAQRNPARDQVAAYVYSKYGYKPVYSWMKGITHVLKSYAPESWDWDNSLWEDWNLSGAPVSLSGAYRSFRVNPLRKGGSYSKEAMKGPGAKFARLVYNPLELLATISEAMEHATRIGEFEKGVWKEGKGGGRARGRKDMAGPALSSREVTVDFSKRGLSPEMQAASQLIPFFNANIQGLARMGVAFNRRNRAKTTVKLLKGIVAPSVLLALANANNDEYNSLSEVDKDLYWHFFIGRYHIWYPKPHELGLIFGALPERMIRQLYQKDPHAMDGIAHTLFQSLPNMIPTVFSPFLEWESNYSRFWAHDIEPGHMVEKLPAFMRYDPHTSESAKWLADLSRGVPGIGDFGVGPKKLENTVRTTLGGAGMTGLRIADYLLFDKMGKKSLPGRGWLQRIAPGFFRRPPGPGAAPLERLYSEMREARQVMGGVKKMRAEGRTEEARAFMEKHRDLYGKYRAFVPVAQILAYKRLEADRIYADDTLGRTEKGKQLNKKWLEIVQIAQSFHQKIHPGSVPFPTLGSDESEDTLQGIQRLLGMEPARKQSRIQELLEGGQ